MSLYIDRHKRRHDELVVTPSNEKNENIKYITRRVQGVVLNPSRSNSPEQLLYSPENLPLKKDDTKIFNQLSEDLDWISSFIEKYGHENESLHSDNSSIPKCPNDNPQTHEFIKKIDLDKSYLHKFIKKDHENTSTSSYNEERAMFSRATYTKETREYVKSPLIPSLSNSTLISPKCEKEPTENRNNSISENEEPGPHSIPKVSRRDNYLNPDDRPLLPPPNIQDHSKETSPSEKERNRIKLPQDSATVYKHKAPHSISVQKKITCNDHQKKLVKKFSKVNVTTKKPPKLSDNIINKSQMKRNSSSTVSKISKNTRSPNKKIKTHNVDHKDNKDEKLKKQKTETTILNKNLTDISEKGSNSNDTKQESKELIKNKSEHSTKKKYYKYKGPEKKPEQISCSHRRESKTLRPDIHEIVKKQRDERRHQLKLKETITKAQDERRQQQLNALEKRSKNALLRSKKRQINKNEISPNISKEETKNFESLEVEPLKVPKLNLFEVNEKIPSLNIESGNHVNSENVSNSVLNTQDLVKDIISLTKSVYSDLKLHTPNISQKTRNNDEIVKSPRRFDFNDLEEEIKQFINMENSKSFKDSYKQSQSKVHTSNNYSEHSKLTTIVNENLELIDISKTQENSELITKLKSPNESDSSISKSTGSSNLELEKYPLNSQNINTFPEKLISSGRIERVHKASSPISFEKHDIGVGVSSYDNVEKKSSYDSESNESAYNFITAVKLKLLNQTSKSPRPPPTRFIDLSSSISLGSVFFNKPKDNLHIPSSITRAVQTNIGTSNSDIQSDLTLKHNFSSRNSFSESVINEIVSPPLTPASELQRQFQTSLNLLDTVQQSRLQLQEAETIHSLLNATKNNKDLNKENTIVKRDFPNKDSTSFNKVEEKIIPSDQLEENIINKRNFIHTREKSDYRRVSNANDSFLLTIRKERLEFDEMLRSTKDTLLKRSFGFEQSFSQFPAEQFKPLVNPNPKKDYMEQSTSYKQNDYKTSTIDDNQTDNNTNDSKILTELTNNSGSSKQSLNEVQTISKSKSSLINLFDKGSLQEISDNISSTSKITTRGENKNTKSYSVTQSEISEYSNIHKNYSDKTIEVINKMINEEEIRSQRILDILTLRMKHLKEKVKAELTWLDIQKREYRQVKQKDEITKIKLKEKQTIKKLIEEKMEIKKQQQRQKKQSEERVTELKRQLNLLIFNDKDNQKNELKDIRLTNHSDIPEIDLSSKLYKRPDSRKRAPICSPSSSSDRPPAKCSKGTSPIDWIAVNESSKKKIMKNDDTKLIKMNEKVVRDSTTSPIEIISSISTVNSINQNLEETNNTKSNESKISESIPEQITSSKQTITNQDNFYSESFDSESAISIPSSVKDHSQKERKIEEKEVSTINKTPLNKIQTDRRKSTSFIIKPNVTPKNAPVRQRRYSSGSDESVIFSQAETASEHSDIEGRIGALREQLCQYKLQADRLKKEQKRLNRERLISKEQSLIKQLNAYSTFIEKATLELEQQKSFIESGGDNSSFSFISSVVKPKIKQPRLVERVRKNTKNVCESLTTVDPTEENLEDKLINSKESPKYSNTFTNYSETEILKSNLTSQQETNEKSQIIDNSEENSEKSKIDTIDEDIKSLKSQTDNEIIQEEDKINNQKELINSSSIIEEENLYSETSKIESSDYSQKSLIINKKSEELSINNEKSKSEEIILEELSIKNEKSKSEEIILDLKKMIKEKNNEDLEQKIYQNDLLDKKDLSINEEENVNENKKLIVNKENKNINLTIEQNIDDKDTLDETTSIEEEIYNLNSLDSEKSLDNEIMKNSEEVEDVDDNVHPLEIINNLLDKAEEVLYQVESNSNEMINNRNDQLHLFDDKNLNSLNLIENIEQKLVIDENKDKQIEIVENKIDIKEENEMLKNKLEKMKQLNEENFEEKNDYESLIMKDKISEEEDEEEVEEEIISDIISVKLRPKVEVTKFKEDQIDTLTDSILKSLIDDSLKTTFKKSQRNKNISSKIVSINDTTDGDVRRRDRSLNVSPSPSQPHDPSVSTDDVSIEEDNTSIPMPTKKIVSASNKEDKNLASSKVELGLAISVSGDNDPFTQEWFDEDYSLGRNPEAEELRLQQLKIEHEIQKLQEEQEQSGYYFIRAIPNKPPPPYTPPSQPKTVAVPNTQEQVCQIVRQIGRHLFNLWIENGESGLEDVQPPSFLISEIGSLQTLEDKSERHYKLFLYELTVKLFKEAYGLVSCGMLSPPLIDPNWTKAVGGKIRRRKTPPKTEELLLSMIERQVNVLLGFEPDTYRERLVAKWPRKKGESVDELLMVESYEEEVDWVNYDDDELALKNQITTSMLNQLISETILVFKEILSNKK